MFSFMHFTKADDMLANSKSSFSVDVKDAVPSSFDSRAMVFGVAWVDLDLSSISR